MSLPECFHCKFAELGFPCRDASGSLDFPKIAEGYIAHGRRIALEDLEDGPPPELPPDEDWAADCVYEITHDHPDQILPLLLHGMDACETPSDAAFFAAGPVEDAVCEHGAALIGDLERLAKLSPKVRMFLGCMWGKNRCDPDVWERLGAATRSGPKLDDDFRCAGHGGTGEVLDDAAVGALLQTKAVAVLKELKR